MKITSGEFAGIPLFTPKNHETRPTLSKTRQAVFNMLRPRLPDSVCVDLFSGTGAFGFEALSNAAEKAIFIDKANLELILKNAAKLKVGRERYEVLTCDFELGLERLAKKGQKADIIFADPPYNNGYIINLLKNTHISDILNARGVLVFEVHKKEKKELDGMFFQWKLNKEKEYGDVSILLLQKPGFAG